MKTIAFGKVHFACGKKQLRKNTSFKQHVFLVDPLGVPHVFRTFPHSCFSTPKKRKKHFLTHVSNWAPKNFQQAQSDSKSGPKRNPLRVLEWARGAELPGHLVFLSLSLSLSVSVSLLPFSLSLCLSTQTQTFFSTKLCAQSSHVVSPMHALVQVAPSRVRVLFPLASESHQTRWQQQLHQVRIELRITISSRIDLFNRIATKGRKSRRMLQVQLSCRASDLIPNNWEGSVEKECTKYIAALHLWMQAWSDQGGKMPVSRKRRHDRQRQPVN